MVDTSETLGFHSKIPPQNLDAEMAVIASVCLMQEAIDLVGDLHADHFYAHRHQLMWQAITDLHDMRRGLDAVTLAERLDDQKLLDECGNVEYIHKVLESVPNAAHASYYADLVRDSWLRRSLTYGCTQVLELIYAKVETDEITASVEKILGTTVEQAVTSAALPMRDIVLDVWHEIQGRKQRGEEPGIPTGFHNLDRIINGWKPDQLIVLAARPSMGKSALAAQLAERLAVQELSTLFLSLEMSRIEIAIRLLASTGRISSTRLISSELLDEMETESILKACGQLQKMPIFIDDRAGRKVRDILAQARMLRRKQQLGALFIDYLQLIEPDDPRIPREQQVATNMRQLKHLAKELHVPVIVLAQLNRAVEAREDKRPRLSDLRESGCLAGSTLIYQPDSGTYRPLSEIVNLSEHTGAVASQIENRIITAPWTHAFSTGVKPVFCLRTGSGRSITATANHRFLTRRGWQRLDQLVAGADFVAVPVYLPGPAVNSMSRQALGLLGHLIGNGCVLARHCVQYTTADQDLAELVSSYAADTFRGSSPALLPRIHRERSWIQVYLTARGLTHGRRNPVSSWFEELGIFNKRSYEKSVPKAVFSQSTEAIGWFLRHLFTTDGCVHHRKRPSRGTGVHDRHITDIASISYSTSSETLAEQVQSLLLRLGITSRISPTASPLSDRLNYQVFVIGLDGKRRFIDRIGFAGERKGALLAEVKTLLETQGLGRTLDGDIYWDAIASIVPAGEENVFDLTVPSTSNFVANNIIVHNSVEQDADVVMFLHRPEAYNPDDRPGEADLNVAKNRNGPTGTAHLSWLASRTQFADLATPGEIAAEQASRAFPAERRTPPERDDPQPEWRTPTPHFSGNRDR